jgi:hypothetical protein
MISTAFTLCFSDNFLESLINGSSKSSGKITAAATTGPAKQPRQRPTSSTPASTQSVWNDFKRADASGSFILFFIIYKLYC